MKRFLSIFFLIFVSSLSAMELSDALRVDGYANIVGEIHNDKNDDTDTFYSSGGIQARYNINDRISATAQLFAAETDDYDVEFKWLYIDYYFGYDLTGRVGRFQFPVFKTLESGYIGYTTTWAKSPLNTYGANGYDSFDGGELLYRYFYDDYTFLLQFSYGVSENDLPANEEGNYMEASTDSLGAVTLKIEHDYFWLNIGYLQAKSDLVSIQNLGTTREDRGSVDFSMISFEGGVNYDDLYLKAGLIDAHLSDVLPDEFRYYVSLEHNFGSFTPYVYYANEFLKYNSVNSTPATNVGDGDGDGPLPPPIRALQRLEYELNKYSAGVRYDLALGVALKASYIHEVYENTYFNSKESREYSEKRSDDKIMAVINVVF